MARFFSTTAERLAIIEADLV